MGKKIISLCGLWIMSKTAFKSEIVYKTNQFPCKVLSNILCLRQISLNYLNQVLFLRNITAAKHFQATGGEHFRFSSPKVLKK